MIDSLEQFKPEDDKLYVIPFGGCGFFGKNMTAYLYNESYVLVDCGVMFPDTDKLGVESIVSDIEPWIERFSTPEALLITHGHEDHIGGLIHFLSRWEVPVYATPWCEQIFMDKCQRYKKPIETKINVQNPGDELNILSFKIDWIHVNHSIPTCCSLGISVGPYKVIHTSDFKIDRSGKFEPEIDIEKFASFKGADLLVTDSTNSEKKGSTPSEVSTLKPIEDIIKSVKGRVYITTFSSNLWRLLIILEACKNLNRKAYVAGMGFLRTMKYAKNLNLIPDALIGVIQNMDGPARSIDKDGVIITSGCQGESLSTLARVIRGEHKFYKIKDDDAIIFSSRLIPGNEKPVYRLTSLCDKEGIQVFNSRNAPDIHVSGHAYQGDLDEIFSAVSPKNYLAVHGSFTQLKANKSVGDSANSNPLAEDGSIYELSSTGLKTVGKFPIHWNYVDRGSSYVLDKYELRERLRIGEFGAAVVSVVSEHTQFIDAKLKFLGIRVPNYIKESTVEKKSHKIIEKEFENLKLQFESNKLEEVLRIQLRRYFEDIFGKKIVVNVTLHSI